MDSCARACFQFVVIWPSTSRPAALRLVSREPPFSFSRSRARLSSMCVADREAEQFDRCGVVGEMAAVLGDLAELVVQ